MSLITIDGQLVVYTARLLFISAFLSTFSLHSLFIYLLSFPLNSAYAETGSLSSSLLIIIELCVIILEYSLPKAIYIALIKLDRYLIQFTSGLLLHISAPHHLPTFDFVYSL